jgi:murein DD-endopeptidase MepM/ murein hydrolase activator NlpD
MRGRLHIIGLSAGASLLTACIPAGPKPHPLGVEDPPVTATQAPISYPARTPAPQPASPPAPRPRLKLDTDLVSLVEREPVWTARPVTPDAVTVTGMTYVVGPGETLNGIGNRSGAGPDIIAKTNGLIPPYVLYPGRRLTIPAGRYHVVRDGDTGIAIAMAYGVEWRRMVALNGLTEPYALRTGQRLLLPSDTPTQPPSPEARAAAFHINIDDVLTGGQPAAADKPKIAAAPVKARPLPTNEPIAQPAAFAGSFAWPLSGKVLTSFGPGKSGERNYGIDIAATRGTPIRASAGGVVAYAGDKVGVFGGLILITHGSGWVTAYGHAERVDVVRGQRVSKGQIIGLTGDTGYADRPKLHFEIRKDRTPVDPIGQLPAR